MPLTEMIQVAKDCITAAAAATGAIVAVLGLKNWKRQLRGNAEYDLARRLLRAAYKVRDGISSVRRPFISMEEIAAAIKETGRSQEELRRYNRPVYEVRWKEVLEAGNELRVAEIEGEALWGKLLKDALAPLEECIKELAIALSEFLRYDDKAELHEAERALKKKYEETLYDRGRPDRPDSFTVAVDKAVDHLVNYLRPKL